MVKNSFSEEEIQAMNNLLTAFFQMNQDCDNIAYALDSYLNCPVAAHIYHEGYAHLWPSDKFADKFSEVITHEGVVPHRYGQVDNSKVYENIVDVFEVNYENTEKIKQQVLDSIELLDYNKNCKPIVVALEDMSVLLSDLLHQCDIWRNKAHAYLEAGKSFKFDIDFEEFTII